MEKPVMNRWLLGLALLALAAIAGAQTMGEQVRISERLTEDAYLMGRSVIVDAIAEGDVVVAGQDVTLGEAVRGDVLAAAEQLNVNGRIGDDLRAVGRRVEVAGDVDGHAVLAGWQVHLAEGSQVRDWLWAAGAEVRIDGVVVGDLKLSAADVVIGGAVGGDTRIAADSVTIRPGASFAGDLTIRSRDPVSVPESVSVGGVLSQSRFPPEGAAQREGDGGGALGWLLVATLSIVLMLLLPRPTRSVVAVLRQRPLASLGLGLAIVAAGPLLAVLLFVTGLGALLGVAVLLVYVLTLLGGVHGALATLANAGLDRVGHGRLAGWRGALAILAAVVIAALVSWIPWLGSLVLLLGFFAGVGAVGLGAWRWRFGPVGG